ncbi:sigma-70 family RNA polymerase sigma factor [Solirubrobacter ginsenosidimutans]|uniref:Sigma-70 family RNA polymerase sigma factor n=1 Tax=Solirubrobacter ginsenosidimutans TaxID=490573 RepID=A0A9X3S1A6_9ACTN|nr:sigma-70 family RNA polymerase sigma factor [Solirubrobacter ginsenosidimutans]MDA0160847.1 sigma-70 family RNA polymerase sigma factor [Solirubrobacter ginsenosidimutans]
MSERLDQPEAFAAFYREHERLLLGFFMRRTGQPELAADLTAETFAAALVSVRKFDPARGPAVGWLLGIAANQFRKACEKGSVEDRARRRLGMPTMVLEDEALKRIERISGDERVQQLLTHLPPDQALAIRARVIDERSYGSIAAELRCSPSVVRQRVSRGLATLRSIAKESE